MSDTVIQVENLSKQYRLGIVGATTISDDIRRYWAKIRGKDDPTLRIGQVNTLNKIQNSEFSSDKYRNQNYVWALKDINFEVKQGEVLGIIGKNGAGKSTLLKILSKVTGPTTGNVKVKGRIASLLEVGTGFHGELTGRENIFLNGAILGMTKAEIKGKFDEIVDFSGIERYIDTPVKRYSSGMYVRLAFAVAAHLEPEILILDEVLAVGDAEFQKKCLGKIGDAAKGGRTIIFVSHNIGAIRQLCSNSILLTSGEIEAQGTTSEICDLYLNKTNISEGKAEIKFQENLNKEFQLLVLKLMNKESEIINNFSCDEDIYIDMICVSRKPVPGLYGALLIYNNDGIHVLMSDTFDIGENIFDKLSSGNYNIRIKIPSRTLGHGSYKVMINFTSSQSFNNFWIDTHECAASFRIDDITTDRGNHRAGYFSTLLKWETNKL
ncbi:MAG TPA: ABC transporter ATP-binding protein [Bacteroidales bacterium]|nr:ABC transporter ATP-binding protein [Bacteroidales bacterium]HPS15975.1 ABC transporter ATP-binding protein [Bacteroidales bacterium]